MTRDRQRLNFGAFGTLDTLDHFFSETAGQEGPGGDALVDGQPDPRGLASSANVYSLGRALRKPNIKKHGPD